MSERGSGFRVPGRVDVVPADIAAAIEAARPRLGQLASPLLFFPRTGSTNDAAAALGTEGAVVVAGAQTAGRGRRGREWFSPESSGLYVSVVVAPGRSPIEPRRATSLLTLAAGVAIAEGLTAAAGIEVDLKWPNDVYASRRKLAGILAEASHDVVVLGYGINARRTAYPPELADRATSVEAERGSAVDRASILVETLAALWRRYRELMDGRFDAILDAWRRRAPSAVGSHVSWSDASGSRTGATAGIDPDGALLVETATGVARIVGGELEWS